MKRVKTFRSFKLGQCPFDLLNWMDAIIWAHVNPKFQDDCTKYELSDKIKVTIEINKDETEI